MNLYHLPRDRQRLFAAGLLALAIAAAAALAIAPVVELVSGKQASIEAAETELVRWQGIAASRDVMEAAASDPMAGSRSAALALPASTDAQAAASVQASVRRAFADASGDLKSIQPLEARNRGGLQEAGVRVVALATHQQLQDTLFAIENASPRMFIREANIQMAGGSRRSADDPDAPVLQVRLDVFAYALKAE